MGGRSYSHSALTAPTVHSPLPGRPAAHSIPSITFGFGICHLCEHSVSFIFHCNTQHSAWHTGHSSQVLANVPSSLEAFWHRHRENCPPPGYIHVHFGERKQLGYREHRAFPREQHSEGARHLPAIPCALLGPWVLPRWPNRWPDTKGLAWAGPIQASFLSVWANRKGCMQVCACVRVCMCVCVRAKVQWVCACLQCNESLPRNHLPQRGAGGGCLKGRPWIEHCFSFSPLQVVLRYFHIQDSAIPTLHSSPLSTTRKKPQLN